MTITKTGYKTVTANVADIMRSRCSIWSALLFALWIKRGQDVADAFAGVSRTSHFALPKHSSCCFRSSGHRGVGNVDLLAKNEAIEVTDYPEEFPKAKLDEIWSDLDRLDVWKKELNTTLGELRGQIQLRRDESSELLQRKNEINRQITEIDRQRGNVEEKLKKLNSNLTTKQSPQTQELDYAELLAQYQQLTAQKDKLTAQKDKITDQKDELTAQKDKITDQREKIDKELIPIIHLDRQCSVLYTKVNDRIIALQESSRKPEGRILPRLATIDFEIESTELLFKHDYYEFKARVQALFKWFSGEMKEYLAPCFAMIQSSGMGKTKLMYELSKGCDQDKAVILVYCTISKFDTKPELFHESLLVVSAAAILDIGKESQRIRDDLKRIVEKTGKTEVVLLFDEAQHLLETDGGFPFRAVRWWLRDSNIPQRVVAVFAGTTSKLSNFLREDPEVSRLSRDPKGVYNSGTKLYDPFFQLCTIGLMKNMKPSYPMTDLDQALRFGRPLFALLAADKPLDNSALAVIRMRLLLGETDFLGLSEESCLSVLGTRVQMGETVIQVSSSIVALGYACLTHAFSSDKGTSASSICFFPDPACSYVAMNLMRVENDSSEHQEFTSIQGHAPLWWTRKAGQIFSSGLCRPHKGNVGEVVAALYFLFCGDVLRRAIDRTLRTFAVSLSELLQLAAEPNAVHQSNSSPEVDNPVSTCVSFIQVCRNYLRIPLNELATEQVLEEWFLAGCAFYSFPGCGAYDIVAPIRVCRGNLTKYYPMVISVKNHEVFTAKQRFDAINATIDMLNKTNDKSGVSVLILTGLTPTNAPSSKGNSSSTIRNMFDNWNGTGILNCTIAIPPNDCFGCWDLATQSTSEGGDASEIYTSQFLVHQTANVDSNNFLRQATVQKKPDIMDKFNNLRKAYGDLTPSDSTPDESST